MNLHETSEKIRIIFMSSVMSITTNDFLYTFTGQQQ